MEKATNKEKKCFLCDCPGTEIKCGWDVCHYHAVTDADDETPCPTCGLPKLQPKDPGAEALSDAIVDMVLALPEERRREAQREIMAMLERYARRYRQ